MQNNQTINVQNALMEESVQSQVEELIHLSMDAGKNSKKDRTWNDSNSAASKGESRYSGRDQSDSAA